MTIALKTLERGKNAERDAHDRAVHEHIGKRIRDARERAGLSVADLAGRVGATTSRVARFEQGSVRLAARELLLIARALSRPVSYFFQDVADAGRATAASGPRGEHDASRLRETESLVQAFENIVDETARRDVMRLLREIAANYRLH